MNNLRKKFERFEEAYVKAEREILETKPGLRRTEAEEKRDTAWRMREEVAAEYSAASSRYHTLAQRASRERDQREYHESQERFRAEREVARLAREQRYEENKKKWFSHLFGA